MASSNKSLWPRCASSNKPFLKPPTFGVNQNLWHQGESKPQAERA